MTQGACGTKSCLLATTQALSPPPPPVLSCRAVVSLVSSSKPHQSQDLQSCGLVAQVLCIMSQTVHHCPYVSNTVAHYRTSCGCPCLWLGVDTPLIALRRAPVCPRSGP